MTEDTIEMTEDERAEWLGRWWAMRQYAIEIGLMAERMLIEHNALTPKGRRFLSRDEWRRLTGVRQ